MTQSSVRGGMKDITLSLFFTLEQTQTSEFSFPDWYSYSHLLHKNQSGENVKPRWTLECQRLRVKLTWRKKNQTTRKMGVYRNHSSFPVQPYSSSSILSSSTLWGWMDGGKDGLKYLECSFETSQTKKKKKKIMETITIRGQKHGKVSRERRCK